MGDVYENREAEQLVHGRIHRLQPDHESPQLDLGDVGEPVQRFTIATTALATPQEFGWHGYELELAVDSTPGVAVGVAFSRADADTGRVQRLHPGERFTSVRPFRRVWLVSVGGAGSAVVHLTRTSLASRAPAQGYTQDALVSVYGTVTNPVAGAVIVETPALEDGLVDILWHPYASSSFGGDYYLQHRRAGAAVMTFYDWRHYPSW
ncbi:MAG: hypothetical protein IT383_20800, partial [Deltaproteobacteria bacterium]|nr:hypothetical protein [Deltaproteobacteria bacterium]